MDKIPFVIGLCWGILHAYWIYIIDKRLRNLETQVLEIFQDQNRYLRNIRDALSAIQKKDSNE